ncbi:MAG: hypothetical protein AAGL24_28615 [Pseudomonadota bacterium]
MSTDDDLVDCRAVAANWTSRRRPDAQWLDRLARLDLDADATLTDLESDDWGDAEPFGDLPDLHALRYVPLKLLNVDDLLTLLLWGDLTPYTARLALGCLEDDPLLGSGSLEGWLLEYSARALVMTDAPSSARSAGSMAFQARLEATYREALARLHDKVRDVAQTKGLDPEGAIADMEDGHRGRRRNPIASLEKTRQSLARTADYLWPREICLQAEADILFRGNNRHEHLPDRLARPDDRSLEDWDKSRFPDIVRSVRFEIVREGARFRLRFEANPPTVLQNRIGLPFDSVGAARDEAERRFGLPKDAWKGPE